LEQDFKNFPGGDLSEIGEGGINLSGGQKARTSLARAVYANADVLIMDDPVSALDATLRKNIFLEVFQGLCKDKTRVLATHAVDFLNLSDRVVIMDDGKVNAQGTYAELKDSNPILQRILKAYYDN
jgi:ABC-type bacteriocin/lantibiotic exporter with double-glycine peptidase domain